MVATCFVLNFVIGSGFLGVPYAFEQAGVLLGPLLVAAVTLLLLHTAMYELEAMAIAEAVTRHALLNGGRLDS